MHRLSRRRFTGWLLAFTSLPFASRVVALPDDEKKPIVVPAKIAGHDLTDDEKQLVRKFLDGYEQTMAPLRARDLPNALPPAIVYRSPRMDAGKERP